MWMQEKQPYRRECYIPVGQSGPWEEWIIGMPFLDTYALERERGITIFSKQAVFPLGTTKVTLLDTPGHVDFSPEMERTLQVLDYAILVISGADGVQGHTRTLWNLLRRYEIPTFVFINKMDQKGTDAEVLLQELKNVLEEGCVDFSTKRDVHFYEEAAVCSEDALEEFLETGRLKKGDATGAVFRKTALSVFFWFGTPVRRSKKNS